MSRRLVPILVLSLFIVISGCAAGRSGVQGQYPEKNTSGDNKAPESKEPKAEKKNEGAEYTNPSYGWSIRYPRAWKLDDSNPGFVKLEPEAGSPHALIGIQANRVGFKTLDDFINYRLGNKKHSLKAQDKSWDLTSRRNISLRNDVPAVELIIETGPGEKSRSICTLVEGLAVCADAETSIEEWDNFSPSFDMILDSLVVKKGR